jgi:hypothetical protein
MLETKNRCIMREGKSQFVGAGASLAWYGFHTNIKTPARECFVDHSLSLPDEKKILRNTSLFLFRFIVLMFLRCIISCTTYVQDPGHCASEDGRLSVPRSASSITSESERGEAEVSRQVPRYWHELRKSKLKSTQVKIDS